MTPNELKECVIELIETHNTEVWDILEADMLLDDKTSTQIDRNGKYLLQKVEDLDFEPEETNDIVIQCDNMVLRQKIETFLETEIYPFYTEYKAKVTGL